MEFCRSGEVIVNKVDIDKATRRRLNENTILFFTGVTRKANGILREQESNISRRLGVLNELKQIAYTACDELVSGNLDAIGSLMHESWLLKKSLANGVSNGEIDEMYRAARNAGALGGKVAGAGGGGFLILYCAHDRQEHVRKALAGLQELPFLLENDGSKVIFNYQRS